MTPKTSVSVIIPNWNGKSILTKNLPPVIAACPEAEILVVDDQSTDDSVMFLKDTYPKIKIVEVKSHKGFASTVNAGVAVASGEIVVLLNTDVAPAKEFLSPLINHFQNPRVFGVGCLDRSIESSGEISRGRGLIRWDRGFLLHSRGEVDRDTTAWVSGGSGAFRRQIWMDLGGMDPLYNPFYWEDIDLSYRALKAGYSLHFEPKSVVIHNHEEGAIKTTVTKETIEGIAMRNQCFFVWKNISNRGLLFSHIIWLPLHLLRWVLTVKFQYLRGFAQALLGLVRIFAARKHTSRFWKIDDEVILNQFKKEL